MVEFAVTCHFLEKHLVPESRILDIGGGPGCYAIWLAQRKHRVVLADLSPKLLEIAREKIGETGVSEYIEEIVEADVCNLSRWSRDAFDAVVCLGPYYHLPNLDDRQWAAKEIARVLRPGGLLFAAMMPRFGFLRRTLAMPDERRHLRDSEFVDRVLNNGVFENDIPGRFTSGYRFTPEEVEEFFAGHGFSKIGLYAAQGITIGIQRSMHELAENDPGTYKAALELVVRTADDPSKLGIAAHLLLYRQKELTIMIEVRQFSPQAIKKAYDARSWIYSKLVAPREFKNHLQAIEQAKILTDEKVLEVAVGPGLSLLELAKRVGNDTRIYGVDLSTHMLDLTEKRLHQEGFLNGELREADCRELPFEDDIFDALYNGYMLDLIPLDDLSVVLAEFKRVLKPGGRLILLNMSKEDERITRAEKLYSRLPATFVLYFFGMCRPVLMEGLVKDAGFVHVSRTFIKGTVASEVITAKKQL